MKKNTQSFNKVSFVVIAHTDDWQLFMCPNVHHELLEKDRKVIFIVTTAGDAGMQEKFWRAREEGQKSSVRFCLAPVANVYESSGIKKVNGQTVNYWTLNNTTTYFFRLPDGNLNGRGFSENNFQSLGRLRDGSVNIITAVDNSAAYSSWQALVSSVDAIVSFEGRDIQQKSIHYLSPDTAANPNDHPDHAATGELIQQINIVQSMDQFKYVGYSTSTNREQLSLKDFFWKTGMLAVYEKAVYDGSGYSTLKENPDLYIKWCTASAQYINRESLAAV